MSKKRCSVEGCDEPHKGKSYCAMHYHQWNKHGDPLIKLREPPKPTLRERFEDKVEIREGSDCHWWTATRDKKGYGQIKKNGKYVFAHRVSYELYKGPIPEGLCVCHTCDNPPCVHPGHLFAGTLQQNSEDMVLKGRSVRGESNGRAKLTIGQVLTIRNLSGQLSQTRIATMFDVSPTTVSGIVSRKSWGHV